MLNIPKINWGKQTLFNNVGFTLQCSQADWGISHSSAYCDPLLDIGPPQVAVQHLVFHLSD